MTEKHGRYDVVCQFSGDTLAISIGEPDEVIPQLRTVRSIYQRGIAVRNQYGLIIEEITDPETRQGKSSKYW